MASFTALLHEKEVKRKQDKLLLINIRFHKLKDAKDEKSTLYRSQKCRH